MQFILKTENSVSNSSNFIHSESFYFFIYLFVFFFLVDFIVNKWKSEERIVREKIAKCLVNFCSCVVVIRDTHEFKKQKKI